MKRSRVAGNVYYSFRYIVINAIVHLTESRSIASLSRDGHFVSRSKKCTFSFLSIPNRDLFAFDFIVELS